MKSSPILSVLLPNYNNADYLNECIDSLLNQTFSDFLIYFVDDCSTDNSLELIRKYTDPRICVIEKSKNSGIVDTLNIGLEKITSKYTVRMDGDDMATPDRFEKLVSYMEQHAEFDVCGSAIQTFGVTNNLIRYGNSTNENKAKLLFGHGLGHASCIFRTQTLKKNNITYQDNYWRLEDYDLFYRLKDIANTTSIEDPLYLYRQEEYNTNAALEERKNGEYLRFYEMVLNDMSEEFTAKDAEIHLELSRRATPSKTINIYQNHVNKLKALNNGSYPEVELNHVLQEQLSKLTYKLIDNKKISLIAILKRSRYDKRVLRYALSRYFKK